MTLLCYYKPINANVNNSKNKNIPNKKEKSLSENDENDLSLSKISLLEISIEEEINEPVDQTNSQRNPILLFQKKKTSKLRILKRNIKVKINKKGFQRKWFKEFSWLRYDSKEKKMYCKLYRFHDINIPFAKEGSKNIGKKSAI
ncbi:hypothetical protein C1645_731997 [Glomus cerebriforme]|uniref:C17orf113 probable zinc finger domain-containing protein n=1 Tax=Glomus cerebriforme TaxID=658196 RepID=A0A397TKT8_9GLOM|nr:hypothetical protein C1645_731997 [Glomus cerebriforme]